MRVDALAASQNAEDLLGYAVLHEGLSWRWAAQGRRALPKGRAHALAEAHRLAPNNAAVAWMVARDCLGDKKCDHDLRIARLTRLEPDNLAVWMLAIEAAMERDDLARAEALVQIAARARYLDTHRGDLGRSALRAIAPVRALPACERAAVVIGEMLEMGRPGTTQDLAFVQANALATLQLMLGRHTLKLCPARGPIPAHRVAACRSIFARMAEGDDWLHHVLGTTGMAAHAATPAERAHWRERLRNVHWATLETAGLMGLAHARLAWDEGEVDVMLDLLEQAGRWPAPPEWLPEDPQARALITATDPAG